MRCAFVVAITIISRSAAATCGDDAAALRARLEAEAHRARVWNAAWAIGFGAAAIGQVVLARTEVNPLGTFDKNSEESLYVGAIKATIGAGARIVLPLRIAIPAPDADACADLAALHAAVATAGRIERRTVLLTLLGGFAVNLAGSIVLWSRRDLSTAALSFGIGAPISPISAFTQPRGMWQAWRLEVGGDLRSVRIARDF